MLLFIIFINNKLFYTIIFFIYLFICVCNSSELCTFISYNYILIKNFIIYFQLCVFSEISLFFQELLRDSQVHLLQLNSVELATQLTIEDFSIFRQIEPTEYIDELFEVCSKYGTPMLSKFVEVCFLNKNRTLNLNVL